jgi:transcriptional regulator with XRE-family HTH domain
MPQASVDQLMVQLGEQLRSERVRRRMEQKDLAKDAGIARSALSRLENGAGGNLQTFVAVTRALGKTDWLTRLAPPVAVDPLEMLRNRQPMAQRVRRRKDEIGKE